MHRYWPFAFLLFCAFGLWMGLSSQTSRTVLIENNSADTLNAKTIIVGGIIFAYADMHVSDASFTIPMSQNTYAHITNGTGTFFTSDIAKNLTFQADSFIIERSGVYRFSLHLSFVGAQNDVYECVLSINDVIDNDHKFTRKTSSNDVGDASFNGLLRLEEGDGLKIEIRNTANNKDATIVNACLNLNRIDL